jgi:hypothetical protein
VQLWRLRHWLSACLPQCKYRPSLFLRQCRRWCRAFGSPDDANAAPLCKTYLALKSNADGDARINALVGSVVISRKQIHSVSEYGEGNFYALQSIAATGKGKWKAKTALTLDGDGDDRLASAVPMTFALKGARLTVTETHANDKQPFVRKLVKCTAKLPKGY